MPTIQEQMAANSAAWHNATTQAEKDALHEANVKLAGQLNSGATFDSASGKWSGLDGGNGVQSSGQNNVSSTLGTLYGGGNGVNYGDTDYSVAIQNAIAQGADAAVIQALQDARNAKIAANPSLSKYAGDQYSQMAESYIAQNSVKKPEIMSFDEFLAQSGYSNYQSEVQSAIASQVQAAVDAYNKQIADTETSYQDNARQAYINKMLGQKNLDQALAANGYAGGMADSQRIATETSYQNQLNSLATARDQTIAEIKAAITQARLAGDQQMAELLSSYLQNIEGYYQEYSANQEAYSKQEASDNTNYYRSIAESILASGQMPTDDILTLAGIDKSAAQSLLGTVNGTENAKPALSASQAYAAYNKGMRTDDVLSAMDYYYGTNYSGGAAEVQSANAGNAGNTGTTGTRRTSYNNGSLTRDQIRVLQQDLNKYLPEGQKISEDGYWGPATQAAAGGYTADEYAKAYYATHSFSGRSDR